MVTYFQNVGLKAIVAADTVHYVNADRLDTSKARTYTIALVD